MPTDPTKLDPAHAELLAKARAATPGPWEVEYAGMSRRINGNVTIEYDEDDPDPVRCATRLAEVLGNATSQKITQHNADFIAAANPAAIIDLITQLGETRAAIEGIGRRTTEVLRAYQCREIDDSALYPVLLDIESTCASLAKRWIKVAARGTAAGEGGSR